MEVGPALIVDRFVRDTDCDANVLTEYIYGSTSEVSTWKKTQAPKRDILDRENTI